MQNGLTSRDVWAERFLGLVLLFLGSVSYTHLRAHET